ncbi:MAG: hypothetical protein QOJ69_1803, partial [Actinomycetota bacterium]|nr:hypothetical protein [Actinomycetota bacterium]
MVGKAVEGTPGSAAVMQITLSGSISVEAGGVLVDEARLGGARARVAFALLVLERRRPVDRHELAEALWPGALPSSWESAVRAVVSRVRAFLAAAGLPASELLTSKFGCYQLTLPANAVVDVEQALRSVEAAEMALAGGSAERALPEAVLARSITAEPFLVGAEGEWADAVRRRLVDVRVRALDAVARSAIGTGELRMALEAAQELVALEPYRDASHVLLMEAHRAAGNRGEALRAYGRARHVLAEELGVDPSPETEALYRSLLNEEHGSVPAERAVVWAPTVADRPPNNLPAPLSTFIGRDRELREMSKLLEADRLVTLTGPAGSGKTRLAVELAARSLASHADGSWFVDLAPLADPGLVPQTVAAAVGVIQQPPRNLVETLVDHLRAREAILVFDNCEHLLAPSAALVDALLQACPLLWVLATSREPLGVPGEVVWRVPPLTMPSDPGPSDPGPSDPGPSDTGPSDPGASEPGPSDAGSDARLDGSIEVLMNYEAPRLFVDRAHALVTDHSFVDADAPALAQICRRLDGIPLAIELAAACTPALSVQQIADRLDDRFHLLTQGSRTAQARHQTLLAAVAWSHDLLTPAEQALLRRLSVLAGGWALEAAEEVGSGGG